MNTCIMEGSVSMVKKLGFDAGRRMHSKNAHYTRVLKMKMFKGGPKNLTFLKRP